MQAMLDPRLLPHLRYVAMTDGSLMAGAAEEGLNAVLGALQAFAGERQRQTSEGTFDPMREITAFNRGMLNVEKPITLAAILAEQDARAWTAIAQDDPEAALQFYRGLQALAYNL